jgi:hypothetical protein
LERLGALLQVSGSIEPPLVTAPATVLARGEGRITSSFLADSIQFSAFQGESSAAAGSQNENTRFALSKPMSFDLFEKTDDFHYDPTLYTRWDSHGDSSSSESQHADRLGKRFAGLLNQYVLILH